MFVGYCIQCSYLSRSCEYCTFSGGLYSIRLIIMLLSLRLLRPFVLFYRPALRLLLLEAPAALYSQLCLLVLGHTATDPQFKRGDNPIHVHNHGEIESGGAEHHYGAAAAAASRHPPPLLSAATGLRSQRRWRRGAGRVRDPSGRERAGAGWQQLRGGCAHRRLPLRRLLRPLVRPLQAPRPPGN